MSMSSFFKAFTPQDMAALLRQPSLIDAREEPQNLIIAFHKLVVFYQAAAAQQLAVIHYAA